MAFDGIVLANVAWELTNRLLGGRIDKIYLPEKDMVIISIRSQGENHKLLLSASPSHPRVHLTGIAVDNPLTPPLFCMVLRKHLTGGKLVHIEQPQFERILEFTVESLNELGDRTNKKLYIEIMGKHSNIILTNENGLILDAAKHVSHDKSSVREILPGKEYVLPPNQDKLNPMEATPEKVKQMIGEKKHLTPQKALYQSFSGVGPLSAMEMCYLSFPLFDANLPAGQLPEKELDLLCANFCKKMDMFKNGEFEPEIIFNENGEVWEFSAFPLTIYNHLKKETYSAISNLLEFFYYKKDAVTRVNQKVQDLKKIAQNNLERCVKKKEIQLKTLKETENKEEMKRFGELITAYLHQLEKGMTTCEVLNFYEPDQPTICIPLDPTLSPAENAQFYFKKYNKAKRTLEALQEQMKQNDEEMRYFENILSSIELCQVEQDIQDIREELIQEGYLKKKKLKNIKAVKKTSQPMTFTSSDGFTIYVGKNNRQNDELTLKTAVGNDLWLHVKDMPGSHVIIKTNGQPVPDNTLNEAAHLAAFYSKGKNSALVPVDYTIKKYVKKPSGAKPGMVIYTNNKTAYITPSEDLVNTLENR